MQGNIQLQRAGAELPAIFPRACGGAASCRAEGRLSELHPAVVFQKGKGQTPPESHHVLPFELDQS